MKSITTIFENKYAGIFCLLLAFANRVVNVFFVSYTGRDKMVVVMQSKNLLEGNGLSVTQYFTTDIATPVYNFTPLWPPGYPFLLAPFLKVFNYDIYWATTVLDVLSAIAIIFLIRKLCGQLKFPIAAVNIATLVAGCFEYTFISESLPTDTVSIAFFLTGLSCTFRLLSSDRFSLSAVLFTAFFLFSPLLFRYSYPPLSLAVGFGVLLTGFIKRDQMLIKKGAWLFVFTLLAIAVFFITLKLTTGHAGYALPTERGIFPENLIHWYPVMPASLINTAFFSSQVIRYTGLPLNEIMLLLEMVNLIFLLLLIVFFISLLLKKEFFSALDPFRWFLLIGFIVSAAIFLSLGYLSLTYEMQRGLEKTWTYIYESRYYAFTILFLQVSFLGWLFLKNAFSKKLFWKLIAGVCSFVLFIEITHNVYFHSKVAFNFKKYKSAVYREQDYKYFFTLMDTIGKKYPGCNIWAGAPGDSFYSLTASYYGYTGIADAANLKQNLPEPNQKTILLLMLYDHEWPEYEKFLVETRAQHLNKTGNSNVFLIELMP